jgi:hypothetical protein
VQSEFGRFDHQLFSIEYPIEWVNITKKPTRLSLVPILAYCHRNKRKGLLGAIADAAYWRPDADFAVFELSLQQVNEVIRSRPQSESDDIMFNYILHRFYPPRIKGEVVLKQKENLAGRALYRLTVNVYGCQSEFRLVAVNEEFALILQHTTTLGALDDFKQTFQRIVQSFAIKS